MEAALAQQAAADQQLVDKMPADIFTKPLGYGPFTKFRQFMLNM